MDELIIEKPVKLTKRAAATEEMALKSILGVVNTPEFSDNDGNGPFQRPPNEIPTAVEQSAAVFKPVPVATPIIKRELPSRIFTTGRLCAGKDYVLGALGYQIRGFAEPLYAMQKYFFGSDDKTLPGARKFLQMAGQYGRGQVDTKYPLSTARATFVTMVRGLGMNKHFPEAFKVAWQEFGLTADLWLDALIARSADWDEETRFAVSNVRFSNELNALTAAGWTHFHVMCSPQTLAKRLAERGLKPESPEVNDTSEQLALSMDRDSIQRARLKPNGPKLRVIWNDPEMKSPSSRFYTLGELQ